MNGQAWASRLNNSLTSVWPSVEAATPLVEYASDPHAPSSFLISASYLATLRSEYEKASQLWLHADTLCERYKLSFARQLCLVVGTYADIALGRLRIAARSVSSLRETATDWSDSYLETNARTLGGRLELAKGDVPRALDVLTRPLAYPPNPVLQAEPLATAAVVKAGLGYTSEALLDATQATTLSRCVEVRYLARFSEAIVRLRSQPDGESSEYLIELFLDAESHGVLDPVVVAYRSYPPLLAIVARDRRTTRSIAGLCGRARDFDLARQAGIEIDGCGPARGLLKQLTPREREVLDLMCSGLGNNAIARRLFIAESTVKRHVHHVLTKLGVRSRLQAVLVARDLTDQ